MANQDGLVIAAVYARRRGVSRAAVVKARKSGRLRECFVVLPDGKTMIDPVIADREWDANTDPSRWPYEKRERAAAGAESPDVDDVIVPLEAFSIFNDLDLGGAKGETVVLAVGSDIETAMLIPMTPQTARLVASKMLLKARDCGEDISRLFAR